MILLYIESKKKPEIYRKLLLPKNSSFSMLDEMILLSFDLDGSDYFNFEIVKKDGRISKEKICFLPKHDTDLDTDEELVDEWLRKPGDEAISHVIDNNESFTIRLEIYEELPMNSEAPLCIAGVGNIHTGEMDTIKLEEINELIREVEEADSLLENLEPDYLSLLEISNDLKKLKPWQYFRDDEIWSLATIA